MPKKSFTCKVSLHAHRLRQPRSSAKNNSSGSDKGQNFMEKCRFISQILDVWSQQHCQPSPQHVYGHQDDKGMGPLTFVEHLNVRMDKLAKTLAIRSFGMPPSIPPAVLHIGLGQATCKDPSSLQPSKNHCHMGYTTTQW